MKPFLLKLWNAAVETLQAFISGPEENWYGEVWQAHGPYRTRREAIRAAKEYAEAL